MKQIIFVLVALTISMSSASAQVRINGGADVGAKFIVKNYGDNFTEFQLGERRYQWIPNLLNYPVIDWCLTKDGTAFKTLRKVEVCIRDVGIVSCSMENLTLDRSRAIAFCDQLLGNGDCAHEVSWTPAPQVFEILTVENVGINDSQVYSTLGREPFYPQTCK